MPGGGTCMTAKWLKLPAVKPEDLSLVLRTHTIEGVNFWHFSDFWYLHASTCKIKIVPWVNGHNRNYCFFSTNHFSRVLLKYMHFVKLNRKGHFVIKIKKRTRLPILKRVVILKWAWIKFQFITEKASKLIKWDSI